MVSTYILYYKTRLFCVVFFLQKLRKGPEDGLPAFSLPAVHGILPEQFYVICSVSNESEYMIIADGSMRIYNSHAHNIR